MSPPTEHEGDLRPARGIEQTAPGPRRGVGVASAEDHLDEATLHAYLDDELAAGERRGVAEHLTACARCSEQLSRLGALFSALESLPDATPALDLSSTVVAALHREAEVRPAIDRRRLWWLAPQAIAAALLLAFALPTLGSPWPIATVDAVPLFDVGNLTAGWAATLADGTRAITGLADRAHGAWSDLDGRTSIVFAPYAGWSTATWAGLLLALLPPWWLANRWLLRAGLPPSPRRREQRPA